MVPPSYPGPPETLRSDAKPSIAPRGLTYPRLAVRHAPDVASRTRRASELPHRQFWRVVERTDDSGNGSVVSRKDPPASYHMVLDGQQRVQSLLLALGGDAWGFKLEDRDWAQELQGRRPRGQGKHRHWSKASLCFDCDGFLAEYHWTEPSAVDFRSRVAVGDNRPCKGRSKWSKPTTYEEPLPRSFAERNRGRFIRLSRLWVAATPNPAIKEAPSSERFSKVCLPWRVCPRTKPRSCWGQWAN